MVRLFQMAAALFWGAGAATPQAWALNPYGIDCMKAINDESAFAQLAKEFRTLSQSRPVPSVADMVQFLQKKQILSRPQTLNIAGVDTPLIQFLPGNEHQISRIAQLARQNYGVAVYAAPEFKEGFFIYDWNSPQTYVRKIIGIVLGIDDLEAVIRSPYKTTPKLRRLLNTAFLSNRDPKNYAAHYRGFIRHPGLPGFEELSLMDIPAYLETLRAETQDLSTYIYSSIDELKDTDPVLHEEKIFTLNDLTVNLIRMAFYLSDFYTKLATQVQSQHLKLTPTGTVLEFKSRDIDGLEATILLSSRTDRILTLHEAFKELKLREKESRQIARAFYFLPRSYVDVVRSELLEAMIYFDPEPFARAADAILADRNQGDLGSIEKLHRLIIQRRSNP